MTKTLITTARGNFYHYEASEGNTFYTNGSTCQAFDTKAEELPEDIEEITLAEAEERQAQAEQEQDQ